jgi:hypothetical protein
MTNLNEMFNFFYGFIVFHPLISMGIAAAMGIILYLKPKEIIKVTAVFIGILIVVYLLSYLTGASKTGYIEKQRMVNQNVDSED